RVGVFTHAPDLTGLIEHCLFESLNQRAGRFILFKRSIHLTVYRLFYRSQKQPFLLLFATRSFDLALVAIEDRDGSTKKETQRIARPSHSLLPPKFGAQSEIDLSLSNLESEICRRACLFLPFGKKIGTHLPCLFQYKFASRWCAVSPQLTDRFDGSG